MGDERQDHELGDSALDQALTTVLIDSETVQGPSRGLSDSDVFILEQLLQALVGVLKYLTADAAKGETALEKRRLLANFTVFVL